MATLYCPECIEREQNIVIRDGFHSAPRPCSLILKSGMGFLVFSPLLNLSNLVARHSLVLTSRNQCISISKSLCSVYLETQKHTCRTWYLPWRLLFTLFHIHSRDITKFWRRHGKLKTINNPISRMLATNIFRGRTFLHIRLLNSNDIFRGSTG
ncbi:hypothetical protein KP509_19G016300 [Ceratopteris richardii]|uniref:Uncharacterized protein n=1 Tax=Ceratopteris richardii TaxID=49495 RepID=A0A8T2SM97_CERRI|nr:hypothetical protein KP509_19G016300 [Ceratopteris richardii]